MKDIDPTSGNSLQTEQCKDTKSQILKPVFEFERFGIGIKEIKEEVEQCSEEVNEESELKGLFTVKPVSKWIEQAKKRPIPKMLFSEFWFEGELS